MREDSWLKKKLFRFHCTIETDLTSAKVGVKHALLQMRWLKACGRISYT